MLTLEKPRTDLPDVPLVERPEEPTSPSEDLNDLQEAFLTGTMFRFAATHEFVARDEADSLLAFVASLGSNGKEEAPGGNS